MFSRFFPSAVFAQATNSPSPRQQVEAGAREWPCPACAACSSETGSSRPCPDGACHAIPGLQPLSVAPSPAWLTWECEEPGLSLGVTLRRTHKAFCCQCGPTLSLQSTRYVLSSPSWVLATFDIHTGGVQPIVGTMPDIP